MSLTSTDLIPFAKKLADASATIIRKWFRAGYDVELKADLSPVTIADRDAETVMRRLIQAEYPDHGILGEEFGHLNADADYQWVLDPIDGTKAFVSGSYLFGTLIALLHKGRPMLGVINHPLLNDFLVGDGKQAWLNDRPVHVRPCDRLETALLTGCPYWTVEEYQNRTAFDALSKRVLRYNNWGDCHGYYLVATGGMDIMADPILEIWDLMALIPIIEGAGGCITDWQGNDAVKGRSAIATAGPLHDEVIRMLNP
jgi:histidinol phosphatase-like enzyme (inositol monophosphatase family)